MKIEEVVGRQISIVRERRGLSQAELGQRLGEWLDKPWRKQIVWQAERGQRAFNVVELVAFAHVLDVSVVTLLKPPLEEAEFDMPSGAMLSAADLANSTLPSGDTDEVLHDFEAVLAQVLRRREQDKEDLGTLAVQLEELRAISRKEGK